MDREDNFDVMKFRKNVARKRNIHLKYIPLNGRKTSKSEPMLTERRKKPLFNERVKKRPVVVKKSTVLKRYSDVASKVPIIKKKTSDKLKLPTKTVSKPTNRAKQGFFTSMWYYAKSFLGFNSNASSSTVHRTKSKRPIYVAKRSLKHEVNNDSTEPSQHFLEKNIENQKKIIEIYRKNSKVNDKPNNKDQNGKESLHDNQFKVDIISTGKEQLAAGSNNELKDNELKILIYEKKTNEEILISEEEGKIEAKKEIIADQIVVNKDEIEKEKLITLNKELNKDTSEEITLDEKDVIEHYKQIVLKDNLNEESTSDIVSNLNENNKEFKKVIVIKDTSNKGITIAINTNKSVCEILTKNNSYKTDLNDANTTIIMEIKNTSDNFQENSENCKEDVISLLDVCNAKQNNIAPSKELNNKKKKAPLKVLKKQANLDKKKTPVTKPQKKTNKKPPPKKAQRENTKKCERHRSSKRHARKQRKCSICRGYHSRDFSEERKIRKDKYDDKDHCKFCNRRVTCLYHHTKKNHPDKIRRKHVTSKKSPSTTKNKSTHNFQKKKRTLTVCTNSRRNSFKNKKLKRSVPIKASTSKYNNQSSNSSIDSDSGSDRNDVTKVLSWCYLHYALNAVQHQEKPSRSSQTDGNKPFFISYADYRNVNQAVLKTEASNSDEKIISENIYPSSSFYSTRSNFEDRNIDIDMEVPNSTPQNFTADNI